VIVKGGSGVTGELAKGEHEEGRRGGRGEEEEEEEGRLVWTYRLVRFCFFHDSRARRPPPDGFYERSMQRIPKGGEGGADGHTL